LGPRKLAALRRLVCVSAPVRSGVLSTAALDAFRRRPTVATYVELLIASGGKFVPAVPSPTGTRAGSADRPAGDSPSLLRRAVLAEVARAAAAAAASPPPGGAGRPITAEEAARLGRLVRRARELEGSLVARTEASWADLVSGSAYRDLALRLIDAVKDEIVVVMFFMTYVPGKAHPSNALVEGLVAAHERGVRVTVILDLDRPEDVFGSRLVNADAFNYLSANGVDVVWDRPEKLTHTKLLIVDARDVLAGSHNWTAGSMYAYDDKSLVVRSTALAETLMGVAWAIRGGE